MEENTKIIYRKSASQTIFILLLIASFCFAAYYFYDFHQKEVARLNYYCTPLHESAGDEEKLDLDSSIVKSLYSKVLTNIKEDLSLSGVKDDDYKLYLAFRQIPNSKFYDSNCNLFSDANMIPYTCIETAGVVPRAFKVESLAIAYNDLFGSDNNNLNRNIQLGNNCLVGYQYIEKRGEFVEGQCDINYVTTFRVDKTLKKAYAKDGRIYLVENVKYYGSEGKDLPSNLKSGTYIYTFKLDMNYNYLFESKVLE